MKRILFQVKDSASEGKRSGEGRRFQISFYDIRNPIEVQLGLADLKALSI